MEINMENNRITIQTISAYTEYLHREERAENTIAKYLYDIREFFAWMAGRSVTKEAVTAYKEYLYEKGRSARTVNSVLAALHSCFSFMGWSDCKVKYLKVQRQMFRDTSRELTKEDYLRLVQTAEKQGNVRLALLLETICGTGVRVSEVPYITVQAVQKGRADIFLKGKIRTILIPNKLARKLQKYAKKQKIASGEIFITKSRRGMSRRQIWGEMKRLCKMAGVEASKVFPHNLRHLFARSFYKVCKDIVRLADVLGHSSVETTRIYLITSGSEHSRYLEQLGLVS